MRPLPIFLFAAALLTPLVSCKLDGGSTLAAVEPGPVGEPHADHVTVVLPAETRESDYLHRLERALYSEAALLASTLSGVPVGDPHKAEVFFLGIAGDGTERVFSREVDAFRDYWFEQGLLGDRHLSLVNDRTQVGERPMATRTSIRQALEALGQRMNPDQDLLLLYITSHGSEDHEISLQNTALDLPDLSAQTLADMLDASGIRWRVIFVSACYSGGFIPPLENSRTLVMTAAAADKASFGCHDDAELTYFGQALLNSLASEANARDVFEMLTDEIARREGEEDLENSRPQLFMGEHMPDRLRALPGIF